MAVTGLRGDGGGVVGNVNRWRAQVGPDPVGDADAERLVRPAKVGNAAGHAVDVDGPGPAGGGPRRVLVAFVRRGGETWFFVLSGPAQLVGRQKPVFETFLKTVRFDGPVEK